jgi:AcrR family transcriptional regulator
MKNELLEQVLDREWQMFVRVRSANPAPCQSAPANFRAIRGSLFEMWSEAMLQTYLENLEDALARGRNLLSEKYARMDNLIPALSDNPLIGEIVASEERWQDELRQRYPALYRRCCRSRDPSGDGREFSVYLRCELETYGERTLQLYHENMINAEALKRNLAIEALEQLVRRSGYRDAAHAEAHLASSGT